MAVIVVSGLPRSGTSMLMQMLAAGGIELLTDGARSADEDNPHGYLELEAVKKLGIASDWLAEADGKAVKIIHALIPKLPLRYKYRVILVRRHIGEVLASQRTMLERHGRTGGTTDAAVMGAAFEQQLRKLEQWLRRHRNIDFIDVSYNETLQDPAITARAIGDFLGSDLHLAAMAEAVSNDLYRQKN